VWRAIGRGHQGLIAVKRGDSLAGLALLRAAGEEIGPARPAYRFHTFAGDMAEAMAQAGQVAEGLAAIDEVSAWVEHSDERWLAPELLRIRGEMLRLQDAPGAAAAAEAQFRQALETARPQGALAWELRAATSLARLLRDGGRAAEARALLQPLHDRFTEGFDTADLKASGALLEALRAVLD
jgi:predicted ATPase